MRAAQFLATIGRGSKGSNALEVTEDRAGATSEQQDNVINTVNSLDPYGPSWQLVPGNVAAGTVYAQVPTSETGDLTFTRASTATRTDAAGNIVSVASGVGRIHYRNADGSLSSVGRLLLEPQRTNSIRNSTMVGAVAGSPGTLPTNWANPIISGLSRQIVGIGTENGLPYIDLRFFGTTNTGDGIRVDLETGTSIAATTGQTWAYSLYSKLISGTIPTTSFTFLERNSGGSAVTSGSIAFALTSTLTRFSATRTLSGGATVAFVQSSLNIATLNATAYDFTIRIAAPQMELGGYATTFIPTTTAAVTRLADAASKTGISSLIGQTEGTLFLDFESGANDSADYVFGMNNGAATSRIIIYRSSLNTIITQVRVGGGSQALIATPIVTPNTRYKCAVAYKLNDIAFYVNGAQIGIDTFATIPNCSIISSGDGSGASLFGRPINQAALFPTRLTNAQLAEITTL